VNIAPAVGFCPLARAEFTCYLARMGAWIDNLYQNLAASERAEAQLGLDRFALFVLQYSQRRSEISTESGLTNPKDDPTIQIARAGSSPELIHDK
jgi:hypothetical protein